MELAEDFMGRKGQMRVLGTSTSVFADWCNENLSDDRQTVLSDVQPISESANGRAGEIFVFALKHAKTGTTRKYVLRKKPTEYVVHMDHDFLAEFTFQKKIQATRVPLINVHTYESDDSILGAPFYVMDFLDAKVPPDDPSFHKAGWVADMDRTDQRRLAESNLQALATLHNLDVSKFDFGHVNERAKKAGSHLDWMIDYWWRYSAWACGDKQYATALKALDWLSDNRRDESRLAISWGDARPGNSMFVGAECAALIDWDMSSLGDAEKDLAWWLIMDEFSIRRAGGLSLPGWPSVPEKIQIYDEVYEHEVDLAAVHYYSVYAALAALLFTHRVLSISPDVTEEIIAASMAHPQYSPEILLQDVLDGKFEKKLAQA